LTHPVTWQRRLFNFHVVGFDGWSAAQIHNIWDWKPHAAQYNEVYRGLQAIFLCVFCGKYVN
ncbi:MAG: hypothetical protein VX342_00935, partial [Pseudomonadota bacterium]|nr:hypothetical protein [Pseudomonadota bacterium]